jgi:hypothetical protein
MPLPLAPVPRQGCVATGHPSRQRDAIRSLPRAGQVLHAPLSRARLAIRERHSEKRSAGR